MIDRIYIPTLGRSNEQVTWNNLPIELKKKVWFVIHEKEKDLYDYNAKYLVLDNNIGIANVRKEIVYHAGKIRFCMWDDDVIFYRRNRKYYGDLRINGEYVPDRVRENGKPISKWKMELEDFKDMFNQFNEWMDNESKLIHIGHRRTNLPPLGSTHDNIFFNSMHMIDGNKLSTIIDDIDWTYVQVGEDANFMFEYLSKGLINRKSCEFSAHWDSFQDGGCAVYRDSKFHNKEHGKLQKRWSSDLVIMKAEIIGQGTYGHNIGTIKEFIYKPKLMRKMWLQEQKLNKRVKK